MAEGVRMAEGVGLSPTGRKHLPLSLWESRALGPERAIARGGV